MPRGSVNGEMNVNNAAQLQMFLLGLRQHGVVGVKVYIGVQSLRLSVSLISLSLLSSALISPALRCAALISPAPLSVANLSHAYRGALQ
jgi:hypothetical protein